MEASLQILVIVFLLLVAAAAWRASSAWFPGGLFRRVTIFQWQKGLLYRNGRFEREMAAGSYWLGPTQTLVPINTLARTLEILAQEVFTADRLTVKLSAVLVYRVLDPRKAFETSGAVSAHIADDQAPPAQQALYREAQQALRAIAGSRPLGVLMDDRDRLGGELGTRIVAVAEQHGLALEQAVVRDIIPGTEMRRLFAETERARLEGVAALERARGEQAALRSLSNAARMLKNNPELMNLRLLQAVEARSGKSNTTIILGDGSLARLSHGQSDDAARHDARDGNSNPAAS